MQYDKKIYKTTKLFYSMKRELLIIAGPCAIESKHQLITIAKRLKKLGVTYLRGGAFKPRTDPTSFQGLGEKGLKYLLEAKEKTGLKIVTEILDSSQTFLFKKYKIDVLQIGARNMDNYELLKSIAKNFPTSTILLKRSFSARKKEYLGSINYLKMHGHKGKIIACERGIRCFSNGEYDRFTLDVSFIADLKRDKKFNCDVVVDPSHAAGRADIVEDLTYAGISAGADGMVIEVKLNKNYVPLSDAEQAITIEKLNEIIKNSIKIKKILN